MRIPLTYGFAMAVAGALLTFLLYLAGFHESAERMKSAQWIGFSGGLVIGITCLALAMKEKRARAPRDADWHYGSAAGVGVLTALVASLFGVVSTYVYFRYVNPAFPDIVLAGEVAEMEERGMSSAQIERAEAMIRRWMSPLVMTILQTVLAFVLTCTLALLVAIFFRRRPAEAEAPPPLAA